MVLGSNGPVVAHGLPVRLRTPRPLRGALNAASRFRFGEETAGGPRTRGHTRSSRPTNTEVTGAMDATESRPSERARGSNRCDMCGATFPTDAALHGHLARAHPGDEEEYTTRRVDRPLPTRPPRGADPPEETESSRIEDPVRPPTDPVSAQPDDDERTADGNGEDGEPEVSELSKEMSSRRSRLRKSADDPGGAMGSE